MTWYWLVLGGHTHVRVYMNGGKCGDLVFRNEEFEWIKNGVDPATINLIEESQENRKWMIVG